jgi:hypothetical protein
MIMNGHMDNAALRSMEKSIRIFHWMSLFD